MLDYVSNNATPLIIQRLTLYINETLTIVRKPRAVR